MKRIIVTVIAVMSFAFTNAQSTRFGVKAGLNSATSGGGGTSNGIGFQVGGFAEIKIMDKLAIQPELLYSNQRSKFNFENKNYDLELDYLNIPVLAKYYITDKITVEAGPQIGFLLRPLMSDREGGWEGNKDYYKKIDFGFNLGAGYNFTDNLSAGIRYYIGLANIQAYKGDYQNGGGYFDSKVTNNVLSISAAYKF